MSFLRFGTVSDYQSSQPGLLPDVQPLQGGTVTNLSAGTGITLTPDPIVGTGTIALSPVGASASYGSSTVVPTFTTNTTGQITSVTPAAIAFPAATISTQDEGVPLSSTVNTINFVGAGVTASGAGATTTVTIPGGGSAPTISYSYGDNLGNPGPVALVAANITNLTGVRVYVQLSKITAGANSVITMDVQVRASVTAVPGAHSFTVDLSPMAPVFAGFNAPFIAGDINLESVGSSGLADASRWRCYAFDATTLLISQVDTNQTLFQYVGFTMTWTY